MHGLLTEDIPKHQLSAHVVPAGPCKSMAEKLHPSTSEEDYLGVIWHVKKQVLQIHVMDAQTAGKSLRAYLEDIAGYRRDGW